MKKRVSESGRFARELSRAVAHRGRLEPVYQALSDHWTMVLQRMFPVWTVIGPGLADPGHIELTTRTVYLDADALLGTRHEIASGTLDPRRILATFGVGIHEVMHAIHSKAWIAERDHVLADSADGKLRQLAVDRQLLEEPRMEATGVREFPETTRRGKFIRKAIGAAAVDIILPRLSEAMVLEAMMTGQVSRDMAGRSAVYLLGRTHYGVLDATRLGGLPALWDQVLGTDDMARLNDLFARLIYARDGDNDALSKYAVEYRDDIIGPPPPPPPGGGSSGQGRGAAQGQGHGQGQGEREGEGPADGGSDAEDGEGSGGDADGNGGKQRPDGNTQGNGDADSDGADGQDAGKDGEPTPQSLGEALERAMAEQRDGQLEQLNEDVDLQHVLMSATKPDGEKRRGGGTGAPGGRLPDRGVDRRPCADEVQMARQLARRLHQAREVGLKRMDKRTPGGTFNPRSHMRGRAQRKMGAPVTAHPWEITKVVTAPLQEPHVAVIVDSSGSMSPFEYALGPVVWVLSEGLREFGGKCAVALFGGAARLLTDGSQPMRLVPSITTGGGTAFAGDAISMCAEHLEMENQRRPRFVFIISDGGWWDCETGVEKINELGHLGVPTIHISIGVAPLSVDADRVVIIDDPAEAMDVIAKDTVAALRARGRRR